MVRGGGKRWAVFGPWLLGLAFGCSFAPAPGTPADPDAAAQTPEVGAPSDSGLADADAIAPDAGNDAGFVPDALPVPSDGGFPGPDAGPIRDNRGEDGGVRCPEDWPFQPTTFDPCAPDRPVVEPALNLGPGRWRLTTDSGALRDDDSGQTVRTLTTVRLDQAANETIDLMSVAGFTLDPDATLRVEGSRPWALAVHGEARIRGTVIVESGTPVNCDGPALIDGGASPVGNGGGGGGGGGHRAPGGAGGEGRGDFGRAGASGGPVVGATGLPLRAGCPGGEGGAVTETDDGETTIVATGGAGGMGGGAMLLSVRDRLRVEGAIRATGVRGRGGAEVDDDDARGGAGGGGGGAGGDLLVEAFDVVLVGEVCAGGASGGSGGDRRGSGADGEDGRCASVNTPPGLGPGGRGGAGSATGTGGAGSSGRADSAGGGGGGGSAGRIQVRFFGQGFIGAGVQPPPTVAP